MLACRYLKCSLVEFKCQVVVEQNVNSTVAVVTPEESTTEIAEETIPAAPTVEAEQKEEKPAEEVKFEEETSKEEKTEKIEEEKAPTTAGAVEEGGFNITLLIVIAALAALGFIGFGFFYGRKKTEE